jgi:hypothetical protein
MYRHLSLLGVFVWTLSAAGLSLADTFSVTVDAQSNIFGAGHSTPPAPGDGGGGVLPPFVSLPSVPNVVVCVDSVAGEVCAGEQSWQCYRNADGTQIGSYVRTDITSYNGIAGMIHGESTMFLVGVFVGNQEPTDPAPPRLDFSTGALTDDFAELGPALNQAFFIGDGLANASGVRQVFHAPAGATRLHLGFADAWNFGDPQVPPGWYGDNRGSYSARVTITGEAPTFAYRVSIGALKAKYSTPAGK